MLHKTRAISLQSMPYRETSLIARFFTEEFGLQSFVVNGVRSAKTRISPGLFQAMTLVDLVQYHDNRKDLHRLSEIKPAILLNSVQIHPVKSALAIFVAEYLSRVLKDHLENRSFFAFCWFWISRLDEMQDGYESAHLGFIWHSFSYLGITPENWQKLMENSPQIQMEFKSLLEKFLDDESAFAAFRVPSGVRQLVLDALVHYARSQMDGMGELKSLAILRQVFS